MAFLHVYSPLYLWIKAVLFDLPYIFAFSAVTGQTGSKAQVLQRIREALCLTSRNLNLSPILNDTENNTTGERNHSHFEILSSALCWNIKFNSSNGFINPTESFRKTFDHMHGVIMAS